MPRPTLDITGSWSSGDQYRVLQVLGLPMSNYMVDGIVTCMNRMTDEEDALAARVVTDLDRYDTAKAVQTTADLSNPDNKVLIKADVLEWNVGHGQSGTGREIADAVNNVRLAFMSCPYVPSEGYSGTMLVRS